MKSALIAAIIAISISLAAVTSQAAEIGKGPLTLSNQAKRLLNRYMTLSEPGALAVTTDGKSALYMFCSSAFCSDEAFLKQDVVDNCEIRAQKKGINLPCRVLAVGEEIVWDGPIKNLPRSLKEEDPLAGWDAAGKDVALPESKNPEGVKSFDSLEIGSSVSKTFRIGDNDVPLPKGTWTIMSKSNFERDYDVGTEYIVGVFLGLIENKILKQATRIHSYTARPDSITGSRLLKACSMENYHEVVVANNKRSNQDCRFINQIIFYKKEKYAIWRDAITFLEDRDIPVPKVTPYVGFRFANKTDWVTARYYRNPEADGFDVPDNPGNKSTEWHPDNIESFPKKVAYIKKLKEWGAAWHPKVKNGLSAHR
jgi:hypothetical protein